MRIFCPATLLLPRSASYFGRALSALVLPPLFTCLCTPAPAVGCVARTRTPPRRKSAIVEVGTGCARLGAGCVPGQARTRLRATRPVCLIARAAPNPWPCDCRAGRRPCPHGSRSAFLLGSKVARHGRSGHHLADVETPRR